MPHPYLRSAAAILVTFTAKPEEVRGDNEAGGIGQKS